MHVRTHAHFISRTSLHQYLLYVCHTEFWCPTFQNCLTIKQMSPQCTIICILLKSTRQLPVWSKHAFNVTSRKKENNGHESLQTVHTYNTRSCCKFCYNFHFCKKEVKLVSEFLKRACYMELWNILICSSSVAWNGSSSRTQFLLKRPRQLRSGCGGTFWPSSVPRIGFWGVQTS